MLTSLFTFLAPLTHQVFLSIIMRSIVALSFVVAASAAVDSDFISSLPSAPPLLSKHYSGYLDASATKRLHYYLVEAENADPTTAPTLVWYNGGPGCSSLDGFLYEHGPFRAVFDTAGNSHLNPFEYSWSKLANTLYVEAPVGVGFSHSVAPNPVVDYNCTDDTAAADNLAALKDFFTKFPELKNTELFITGESYAGIYVPTLAEAILLDDEWASSGKYPSLTGIAVGNGCSGTEVGICSWGAQSDVYKTKYFMSTGFVSTQLKDKLNKDCDFETWFNTGQKSKACEEGFATLNFLTADIDTYSIYSDCGPNEPAAVLGASHSKVFGATPPSSPTLGTTSCINSAEASAYLNRADVRAALHVSDANVPSWSVCGSAPGWSYTSTRPNLPRDTYPLLVSKLRVLIYNGDHDACVPYTDGIGWTSGMGLAETKPWHVWFESGKNVGGYATTYDTGSKGTFEFITVRGGRHEVPETEPVKAFVMLQKFLAGEAF